MIFYSHDREVLTDFIKYTPRSCFVMTQLGGEIPKLVTNIRQELSKVLKQNNIKEIDANTLITGRDFLNKIWKQMLGVPIGIAIVSDEMQMGTIANIFYEIGVLNALGKDTIVVKSKDFKIPSDFVRTEYISYDGKFLTKINHFLSDVLELAEHYDVMAENLENNPSLSIDYWRRAFLISGDYKYLNKAKQFFLANKFDKQTTIFIKNFLSAEKNKASPPD